MGEICIKDAIISCLKNQLDCYRDISRFNKKISEFDRKLFFLGKDQTRFDKELSEYYEKLENFESRLHTSLTDYIDNYVEAYLKLEKKKERIEKDNINKVWIYLFSIFFICIIIYLTIL